MNTKYILRLESLDDYSHRLNGDLKNKFTSNVDTLIKIIETNHEQCKDIISKYSNDDAANIIVFKNIERRIRNNVYNSILTEIITTFVSLYCKPVPLNYFQNIILLMFGKHSVLFNSELFNGLAYYQKKEYYNNRELVTVTKYPVIKKKSPAKQNSDKPKIKRKIMISI